MSTIFYKALFVISTCGINSVSLANEQNKALDIMLVSKFAGVCGVMQQMQAFQESTQMAGGTEFITRFWQTEIVRLGKTQEQFFDECERSIDIYSKYTNALHSDNQ